MPLRATLCWTAVLGCIGPVAASDLQPLRVDPALLGGVVTAQPAAAAPTPTPAPAPVAPVAPAASPVAPVVIEAPQRIDVPAANAVPSLTPSLVPVAPLSAPALAPVQPPAAPAPVGQPPQSLPTAAPASPMRNSVEPARTAAGGLPALRVDPALLGTAASVPAVPASARATDPAARPARPAVAAQAAAPVAGTGGLHLRPTTLLTASPSDDERPTVINADLIRGRNDVEMVAEGDAELRKPGTVLTSDRLTYWHLDDEVEALGNVRLERDQDVFTGPRLRMRVEENTGVFDQPSYQLQRTNLIPGVPATESLAGDGEIPPRQSVVRSHGEAERFEFRGEGLYRASKATYSTCAPGKRDWYAEVGELDLDYNREVAEGRDGKVVFMGVPILYSPWLSFSLNNERKSGFLPPSFGTTNTSGTEVSVPWYWNIAPNMDATVTPRVLSKRGVQLNTDIRYLDHAYNGISRLEYLPSDRLYQESRVGYSVVHNHVLGGGFTSAVNLNGVSDDTYFRDLSSPTSGISQNYLLRQGQLSYGAAWWSASILAQRYQVLQDPSLPPVAELYRRTPQVNLNASRFDLPYDGVFNFNGEYVNFGHPTNVTARRTTVYPQLSLPLQNSWLRVVPKVGMHATRYQFERQGATTPASFSRNVPIVSVDSRVVFERDLNLFGRDVTQTLEPRLYYLYVPFRDQSVLNDPARPVNFDTGISDFNFATAFAENRYSGGDRIADANQITAAVTSRIIDPATGAESLRALIGQRYYFTTQHVTLPGEAPRAGRSADVLAALSGRLLPKTYVDSGWQYNPRDRATERFNAGVRYQPELGKVVNAGYRYTRAQLGQIDVSGQWPLSGGWHGVGRYNFSTRDGRLIESVAGLEYDAGCWVARIVARSIATQSQQATTSLFVQLELNGFSRLGSNPLDVLRRNVPGYGVINQQTSMDPASSGLPY